MLIFSFEVAVKTTRGATVESDWRNSVSKYGRHVSRASTTEFPTFMRFCQRFGDESALALRRTNEKWGRWLCIDETLRLVCISDGLLGRRNGPAPPYPHPRL